MDVTIASSKRFPVEKSIRRRIIAKAESALSRLGHLIRRLEFRFDDINGPKGGVCKRCLAVLRLSDGGSITVEHRHESVGGAGVSAIARLRDQLSQQHQRSHMPARLTAAGGGPR